MNHCKEPCPECNGYGFNPRDPKFGCIACMGFGTFPPPEAAGVLRQCCNRILKLTLYLETRNNTYCQRQPRKAR